MFSISGHNKPERKDNPKTLKRPFSTDVLNLRMLASLTEIEGDNDAGSSTCHP